MIKIIIPTINNNDSDALLAEWNINDGAFVKKDDLIAVLETSKTTFELLAPVDGILSQIAKVGESYEFGSEIGFIFNSYKEKDKHKIQNNIPDSTDIVITKAAEKLIKKMNISSKELNKLNKEVIKKVDIEKLLDMSPDLISQKSLLSNHQKAVAAVVSYSHSSIPQSFVVIKIFVDSALEYVNKISSESKKIIGFPDLVVKIVSSLREKHPKFFGKLDDNLFFLHSDAGNIGVTIDVGTELFIPCLKAAHTKALSEIAEILMSFRAKALRNSYTEDELEGADITVSINMDSDVMFVTPIIYPPQTCMITLGAVMEELYMEIDNELKSRRFINIGLAFDHRIVNGKGAIAFLTEIKSIIESQENN